MKKTALYIGILVICVCIATAACSRKDVYAPSAATKNGGYQRRAYFLPSRIDVSGDTIVSVGFMQSQMLYYMNLKTPNDANSLKNLQQAYNNLTLVLVKMDPTDPHKIIMAEPAPTELSRRFRQSLHTDTVKHRIN